MKISLEVLEVVASLRNASMHDEAESLLRIAAGDPSPVELAEAVDALRESALGLGLSMTNARVEHSEGKDKYISVRSVGFQFMSKLIPKLLQGLRDKSRRKIEYSPKKSRELDRTVFKVS